VALDDTATPDSPRPHFGVVLPSTLATNPRRIRRICELAEELGFDAIWVNDVAVGPDPFDLMAFAAAITERVKLGTAVYLLPLRDPTDVARNAATVDRLSGGRVIFGVGVGGDRPGDFAINGRDGRERGARADEMLDVMRRLWAGETVHHAGRHYRVDGQLSITPVQDPVPVWIGGRGGEGPASAVYSRVVERGQGWLPYLMTPDLYAQRSAAIDRAARETNQPPAAFRRTLLEFAYIASTDAEAQRGAMGGPYAGGSIDRVKRYILAGSAETCAERLRAFVAAGVTDFIFNWSVPADQVEEQMRLLSEQVIPAV
jgi:probable F420-dependent oxidoreductase